MGKNPRARVSSVRECDRGVLLFLYMLRGRRWVILTSSLQVHLYHYPFQVWHLINLLNQSLNITIINNTPCIRQVGFGVDSGLVVVATVIIFLICGFYYYYHYYYYHLFRNDDNLDICKIRVVSCSLQK